MSVTMERTSALRLAALAMVIPTQLSESRPLTDSVVGRYVTVERCVDDYVGWAEDACGGNRTPLLRQEVEDAGLVYIEQYGQATRFRFPC